MQSQGSFAVVLDHASRILLCHRTDMDAWNLPGGGVEAGETPEQAVVREAREETGLDVCIRWPVGRYYVRCQQVTVHTFVCERNGGRIRCTEEADRVGWFACDDIPVSTLPRHVERIAHALLYSDRLCVQTQ